MEFVASDRKINKKDNGFKKIWNSCELNEEAAEDYKLDRDHYNIIPVNNEKNPLQKICKDQKNI